MWTSPMWSSRRNRENVDKNDSERSERLRLSCYSDHCSDRRRNYRGAIAETPLDRLHCETNVSQSLICLTLLSRPSVSNRDSLSVSTSPLLSAYRSHWTHFDLNIQMRSLTRGETCSETNSKTNSKTHSKADCETGSEFKGQREPNRFYLIGKKRG